MNRAPLRFLLAVLVLWIGVRTAILLPGPPDDRGPLPAAAETRPAVVVTPARVEATGERGPVASELPAAGRRLADGPLRPLAPAALPDPLPDPNASPVAFLPALPLSSPAPKASPPASAPALSAPPPGPAASRWSASVWLLARDDANGAVLAPGGTLGGSQAGARLTYALGGGLALSGRAYLPLRRASGAELAAGVDWRPLPALPISLLAERRQRLGREGRNAFALTLYGGASRNLTPRLRLDAYGQAGVVGLRSRDLFADGALRLSRRLGPVELGAGAWGAAQPGAARLDAGPSLAWRLPVRDASLRLQADWRFRLAGDAAPRSGPALTLATDF